MQVTSALLGSIAEVIYLLLDLYLWVIIIDAILSWLIAFNVVNTYNRVVVTIGDITRRLTDPVLGPIRKVVPTISGIDLSPMVLIFAIIFLKSFLRRLIT
ncbi:MAG: YggT family protein [Bdellovibrionales bacterium]